MSTQAHIIHFYSAGIQHGFLAKLKSMIEHSSHSYELAAYSLIEDIEELSDRGVLTYDEFHAIIAKAMDVLMYFHFDCESLAKENSWYRASVIHQICCGMLQALRLLRPDLNDHAALNEAAYHLYRQRAPLELWESDAHPVYTAARPLKAKQW